MSFIALDICLSDIPKEAIKKSEKNGKMYVNLVLAARREEGRFGETHTVYVSQTKAEREANAAKAYCGAGREKDVAPGQKNLSANEAHPFAADGNSGSNNAGGGSSYGNGASASDFGSGGNGGGNGGNGSESADDLPF